MQTGDKVTMTVQDVGLGGVGVGRVDGCVVFAPFVTVDETVEVEITTVRKRFAEARLLRVLEPAATRESAPCAYYARCGGCCYQHVAYDQECTLKTQQVRAALERIGRIAEPPVADIVPAPEPYGYRNKITLHGPGRPGFKDISGETTVPIDRCIIATDAVNALLENAPELPEARDTLTCRATTRGDTWRSDRGDRRAVLREDVGGTTYQFGAESFFQVHTAMQAKLLAHLDALLASDPPGVLLDAYCGVGVFAIALASRARECHGIEADRQATHAAAANAQNAGVGNASFYAGQTERLLPDMLSELDPATLCVLLDPPRAGCSDRVVKALTAARPARMLYVSCNPATLARDLKAFGEARYRVASVQPFDMFPRTAHIEVVADCVRM